MRVREPCAACGEPARIIPFDTIRGPEYLCEAHARDRNYRFPKDAPPHLVEARKALLRKSRETAEEIRRELAGEQARREER